MSNIWLISDTHFSHQLMLEIEEDGKRLRPFSSIEEMDETMVERWNATVKHSDHVWHLGDVAMKKRHLSIVSRLNGQLRLVPGNHDICTVKDYLKAGFKKIAGCRIFDDILCTHIPVHPRSAARWAVNAHGHTHALNLGLPFINVSVEQTDYRPVALEDVRAKWPRWKLKEASELARSSEVEPAPHKSAVAASNAAGPTS